MRPLVTAALLGAALALASATVVVALSYKAAPSRLVSYCDVSGCGRFVV